MRDTLLSLDISSRLNQNVYKLVQDYGQFEKFLTHKFCRKRIVDRMFLNLKPRVNFFIDGNKIFF